MQGFVRHRLRILAALAWTLAAVGCADDGASPRPAASPAAAARGAEILGPFKQQLQQALKAGLAAGPAEAIRACNVQAPAIAASLSRDGVRVGRTSHKLRNPANAPADWMQPLLNDYLERPEERAPRALELGAGRVGYAEPISVQALCLTCHGEVIPEAIAAPLAELYPEDRATGFREGDFRGIFWAEFDAPDANP